MKREEALKKIDNIVNVLAVEIPEEMEIYGKVYYLKRDLSSNYREGNILKYESLYEKIREDIKGLENVPEELVNKAIILRRVILFLKEYSHTDEIDDKKRWIKFIRKMK